MDGKDGVSLTSESETDGEHAVSSIPESDATSFSTISDASTVAPQKPPPHLPAPPLRKKLFSRFKIKKIKFWKK